MKKNKAFTLVEVITVLILLSVLIVITTPIISSSSNKTKNKLYETKIKMLENASIIYAQDNYGEMTKNCSNKCEKFITVSDLIPDYYEADAKSPDVNKKVEDPRKHGQFLDEKKIHIMIETKNRKITAIFEK